MSKAPLPDTDGMISGKQARRRRRKATRLGLAAAALVVVGTVGVAAAIAGQFASVAPLRSTPVQADPAPAPAPSEDLGIFASVSGWIVYGDRDGIWGVDPAGPDGSRDQNSASRGSGHPAGVVQRRHAAVDPARRRFRTLAPVRPGCGRVADPGGRAPSVDTEGRTGNLLACVGWRPAGDDDLFDAIGPRWVSCPGLVLALRRAMCQFHSTITIDRPREEVFTYLVDPEMQTIWQSGLQEFDADGKMSPRWVTARGAP